MLSHIRISITPFLPSNLQLCLQFPTLQNLLQSINACLNNLLILSWRPCTSTNPSNNFSLRIQNRQATTKSRKPPSIAISKSVSRSTRPDSFLVGMCAYTMASCCEGLVQCNYIMSDMHYNFRERRVPS